MNVEPNSGEPRGPMASVYEVAERAWRLKGYLVALSCVAVALAGSFVWVRSEVFSSEAVLVPRNESQGINMSAGLRGIASIAGVNLGAGQTTLVYALKYLRSRSFLDRFIEANWGAVSSAAKLNDCDGSADLLEVPARDSDCFVDAFRYLDAAIEIADLEDSAHLVRFSTNDPAAARFLLSSLLSQLDHHLRERRSQEFVTTLGSLRQAAERESIQELRAVIFEAIKEQQVAQATVLASDPLAWEVVQDPTLPYEPSNASTLVVLAASVLAALILYLFGVLVASDFQRWAEERERPSKDPSPRAD